jgi:protein SCO1/2
MNSSSGKVQWTVWGGLVLIILTIGVAFLLTQMKPKERPLPVISQLPDFQLTNQLGNIVTLETLRGNVWVADIIFSRCLGPCPDMTRHMSEVQALIPADKPVKLVTLTTDPEFDTAAVLKTYSEHYGTRADRWWFLTGNKVEIARLAVDGLKLVAVEKASADRDNPNDIFIHSTLFVVVDQEGRLRAAIEAMEPGAPQKVLRAVETLLREKKR